MLDNLRYVKTVALIYAAAVAGLSCFVFTVVLEHVLVPELAPARHTISEYAHARGAAGPLMVVGFLMWAGSLAMTGVLLLRDTLEGRAGMMRVLRGALGALVVIAALGAILLAVFPTQTSAGVLPPGEPASPAGRLHALGSDLIQLCFYPAVLVSLAVPHPRWFSIAAVTLLVVAVAIAPALAVLDIDARGARQRVQLAAGCAWQFALLASRRPSSLSGPAVLAALKARRARDLPGNGRGS